MDIPGFGGNASYNPLDRGKLGQCAHIQDHGQWGPKLKSWQHPIFGIWMGLVFLLLVKQRVFRCSGDYLQMDVIELVDRVTVRSTRLAWEKFIRAKRTVACVIFVTLFLSWAFGRLSGLLVPTMPDVIFGVDLPDFSHLRELRPKSVFPANSWATAVWLFFVHFLSPGISEAIVFHALLMSLPDVPRDIPLLGTEPREAEVSAELQQEETSPKSPGHRLGGAVCCQRRQRNSTAETATVATLRSAGKESVRDVQAALQQQGARRPPCLEYSLAFIVYLLFHYDMWHSNAIERDGRFLVIAMGAWLVSQELVIFTQSIWPAAVLRWIGTWTWVIFFGGGCYFWQGMFAGVGA